MGIQIEISLIYFPSWLAAQFWASRVSKAVILEMQGGGSHSSRNLAKYQSEHQQQQLEHMDESEDKDICDSP